MIFKIVFMYENKIVEETTFDYKYPEDWESLMWPNDDFSIISVPKGFKVKTVKFKIHLSEIYYYLTKEEVQNV